MIDIHQLFFRDSAVILPPKYTIDSPVPCDTNGINNILFFAGHRLDEVICPTC
jgi:hypothetical protein